SLDTQTSDKLNPAGLHPTDHAPYTGTFKFLGPATAIREYRSEDEADGQETRLTHMENNIKKRQECCCRNSSISATRHSPISKHSPVITSPADILKDQSNLVQEKDSNENLNYPINSSATESCHLTSGQLEESLQDSPTTNSNNIHSLCNNTNFNNQLLAVNSGFKRVHSSQDMRGQKNRSPSRRIRESDLMEGRSYKNIRGYNTLGNLETNCFQRGIEKRNESPEKTNAPKKFRNTK
ncbi:hypothetical protein BgiMline_034601, partial [Biomphalaria glabrata]